MMRRLRSLLLLCGGLLLLLLSRGVLRVRSAEHAMGRRGSGAITGRSAQAARTDPALITPEGSPSVDLDAIRTAIRDAGTSVYLPAMFVETDSVLRRWSDTDTPSLRVGYLTGDVPGWDPEDQEIARAALHAWEAEIPVHFAEVLDTTDAQLIIRWVPRFEIDRAGQTDLSWDARGRIHHAVIRLALADSSGRTITRDGLRAVALHEVGHALGLPHSDRADDLMFPTTRRPVMTPRDIATMQLLYRLPPVSIK